MKINKFWIKNCASFNTYGLTLDKMFSFSKIIMFVPKTRKIYFNSYDRQYPNCHIIKTSTKNIKDFYISFSNSFPHKRIRYNFSEIFNKLLKVVTKWSILICRIYLVTKILPKNSKNVPLQAIAMTS